MSKQTKVVRVAHLRPKPAAAPTVTDGKRWGTLRHRDGGATWGINWRRGDTLAEAFGEGVKVTGWGEWLEVGG